MRFDLLQAPLREEMCIKRELIVGMGANDLGVV